MACPLSLDLTQRGQLESGSRRPKSWNWFNRHPLRNDIGEFSHNRDLVHHGRPNLDPGDHGHHGLCHVDRASFRWGWFYKPGIFLHLFDPCPIERRRSLERRPDELAARSTLHMRPDGAIRRRLGHVDRRARLQRRVDHHDGPIPLNGPNAKGPVPPGTGPFAVSSPKPVTFSAAPPQRATPPPPPKH